ncbi:MAG: uroporphyrinogen-III C-methyltransferase [Xanthobacteraceae bacterium]|nr:uroporphyrinogen-III C-methyltransferase [Xanthobacteraceae bacterium]
MTSMLTITSRPAESQRPRMEPLARLPVFFALEGRRAVVAGGTPGAAWKTELLSAAGAEVQVYAPEPCEETVALAIDPPRGTITLHRRAWQSGDIAGATIAVGACENDDEAQRFADAAREAGVPVNVVDRPKFCDFAFGAIVNRSPMVIGISTDGAAPVFGQAIRGKLEAMLPRGFAQWAAAAGRWRAELKASGLSFNARRRFWRLFTERAMTHPDAEPQSFDYDLLLRQMQAEGERVEQGSVALVGAGPGDPELLTLRAVRALQSADIILFDERVSAEVLDFARREAKKLLVGKAQVETETGTLMAGLAKSGRRVVRLKGGDPAAAIDADAEATACRQAGIVLDVVPGVSAHSVRAAEPVQRVA